MGILAAIIIALAIFAGFFLLPPLLIKVEHADNDDPSIKVGTIAVQSQ